MFNLLSFAGKLPHAPVQENSAVAVMESSCKLARTLVFVTSHWIRERTQGKREGNTIKNLDANRQRVESSLGTLVNHHLLSRTTSRSEAGHHIFVQDRDDDKNRIEAVHRVVEIPRRKIHASLKQLEKEEIVLRERYQIDVEKDLDFEAPLG